MTGWGVAAFTRVGWAAAWGTLVGVIQSIKRGEVTVVLRAMTLPGDLEIMSESLYTVMEVDRRLRGRPRLPNALLPNGGRWNEFGRLLAQRDDRL